MLLVRSALGTTQYSLLMFGIFGLHSTSMCFFKAFLRGLFLANVRHEEMSVVANSE